MTALAFADEIANQDTPEDQAARQRKTSRMVSLGFMGDSEDKPYRKRFKTACEIRRPYEKLWRQIRKYVAPDIGWPLNYSGNTAAISEEMYKFDDEKILDTKIRKMVRTAADGLHGTITSQDTQFFSFYAGNYNQYEESFSSEAKEWISNAQDAVRDTFSRSNFYSVIWKAYYESLLTGNALVMAYKDNLNAAQYICKTIGSYWWISSGTNRIDTVFIRHFMRAQHMSDTYGYDSLPRSVQEAVRNGRPDQMFSVIQCIQPWNFFGRNGESPLGFTYEDVLFLEDDCNGGRGNKIISRDGYRTKPFVTIKWTDDGDSTYSLSCPALDSLPDVKSDHKVVDGYFKGVEWRVDPAVVIPDTFDKDAEIFPGAILRAPANSRAANEVYAVVPPIFDVAAANDMQAKLQDNISEHFYNREFLLVQSRQRQITATEVESLNAEKYAVLAPIVARLGDNAILPLCERTYEIILFEWPDMLPDPPEEIQGMSISAYFTNIISESQRNMRTQQKVLSSITMVQNLATIDQNAPKYVDGRKILRNADEGNALIPGIVRNDQEIDELIQGEQEAMQSQQQLDQLGQAASIAKDAGQASVGEESLLGQILSQQGQ